jgi:hypothetical protein
MTRALALDDDSINDTHTNGPSTFGGKRSSVFN